MKLVKRISFIVVAVLLLSCSIPLSSMAVDPVSSAAMANAFAQAVAAYGASQGVSITFDVADTDGIGQGIHELWDEFKTETQDPDVETFDSYAVTLFYNLFKKSSGGGNNNNNDDDKVAIAISAATVAALDKFWNWLLSGPAEMEKVDNQYYEWTVDQNGDVQPIQLINNTNALINGYLLSPLPITRVLSNGNTNTMNAVSGNLYALQVLVYNDPGDPNSIIQPVCIVVDLNNTRFSYNWDNSSTYQANSNTSGGWYYATMSAGWNGSFANNMQEYDAINSQTDPSPYLGQYSSSGIQLVENGIGIRPYVYDPIVQPVTIPDPDDPDYDPQDLILPLNVAWDITQFGDGESTMDDSQAEAVADAIGNSIITAPDKAIELNPSSDTPVTPPSEVYIPFLPVTLPSFQFSLSGIWHYVTAWVASLGSWISLVFTTWSYLPYAISVPVYATAVIVIVLGVYKRFFM